MRQSEDRVERAELWHSQVQALGLVAEDHRMAERPDRETKTQAEREKEKREDARRAVLDEVTDEEPRTRHQRESSQDPRQVKHQDQRQVRDRRQVTEDDPEHEEVGRRARLGRILVLPGPRALPTLAPLGRVGPCAVPGIEEADEGIRPCAYG